ncbi:sugar O-acyltransferase, partial [bacterium]|nr:sugar O-acyltransferase [bacterium]
MKPLVLIGIGETAQLAYEYFTYDSNYTVIAFAVDDEYLPKDQEHFLNLPIVPLSDLKYTHKPTDVDLFVAVSSGKLNRSRSELYTRFKKLDYSFASYISTKCFVWRNVTIGENCFVLENNTLQPFVSIGNN